MKKYNIFKFITNNIQLFLLTNYYIILEDRSLNKKIVAREFKIFKNCGNIK